MGTEPIIEVNDLSKYYAGRRAISRLSFSVNRGEIVGLLGPNGAGKSTTMRILSCFMAASSGSAHIGGKDVFRQADEVRRSIGYMPENNPLYPEMRVREYLKFRARIKGLSGSRLRYNLDNVISQCGLSDVSKKIVGHLSKGYRQRVGLADALIHEPDILILDEPTIGLDPSQIRSVRQLIKSLAGKHTVLISSHILPEVEMTCNRVLVMRDGRILAADTPENLHNSLATRATLIAEIAAPVEDLERAFSQIPDLTEHNITQLEDGYCRCALTTSSSLDFRPSVYDIARQNGWSLRELTRRRHTLEEIYLRLMRSEKEEDVQ